MTAVWTGWAVTAARWVHPAEGASAALRRRPLRLRRPLSCGSGRARGRTWQRARPMGSRKVGSFPATSDRGRPSIGQHAARLSAPIPAGCLWAMPGITSRHTSSPPDPDAAPFPIVGISSRASPYTVVELDYQGTMGGAATCTLPNLSKARRLSARTSSAGSERNASRRGSLQGVG